MAPDQRSRQNLAFGLGLLLILSMLATPLAIASGVQKLNDLASAKKTKELSYLSTANVAQAHYVFYNTTGALVKIDITSRLNTSIIDVPNANGAGFPGLQVDSIVLGATGFGGANETDPSRPSSIELVLNHTSVGAFLDAPLTRVSYTFRAIASGMYTPNTVNATPREYHASTSPDFSLNVGFAQGDVRAVDHGAMTIAEGTSAGAGGNYTRHASVTCARLIEADHAGEEYQSDYDNPVVIKVGGYKAGRNGNLGDSIRFSIRFEAPDGPAAVSCSTGYGGGYFLAGLLYIGGGALATPWVSLKGVDFGSKPKPATGARRRR